MKSQSFTSIALAVLLTSVTSTSSHAFMTASVESKVKIPTNVTQWVDAFRVEVEAGETSSEDMLQKLNAAIEQIDARLDQGVPNEEAFLDARRELVELRSGLSAFATQLTMQVGGPSLGLGGSGGGTFSGPLSSGPAGGGGARGGAGGGLGGAIVPLGIVGAVIGVTASDDDNDPGIPASPSQAN